MSTKQFKMTNYSSNNVKLASRTDIVVL